VHSVHKTKVIAFLLAALLCGVQFGCGGNSVPQDTSPKPPPSVVTASLATGTVGVAYSQTLKATGGVSPYKWSEQSGGALPAGLTLDGNTGVIAGTPSTPGNYGPYVFVVTDSQELRVSSIELPLTINTTAASACPARGNEMALNASTPYAFVLQGYDQSGMAFVMAGSFTPRGDGSVSAGEVDYNGVKLAHGHFSVEASTSGYAFGSDGRGCLFLSLPDSDEQSIFAFRFSLGGKNSSGVYSTGHIIEFENPTGTGPNASGSMHVQDPASFRLDALQSNYAFGLTDVGEGFAGTFANDAGTLSAGFADLGAQSTPVSTGGKGTIASQFSSNGRGSGHYTLSAQNSFDFAMYIVNSTDFYLMSTTSVSDFEDNPNGLLISGRALATAATFGTHPLNGNYLFAELGGSFAPGEPRSSGNFEEIGTLQVESTGAVPEAKVYTTTTPSFFNGGSYTSSAEGRIAITGLGPDAPVIYLTSGGDVGDPVLGFTTGTYGIFGVLVNQNTSSPNFSVADLNGSYSGGTPADPGNQDGGAVYSCIFDGAGSFVATYDAFLNGHKSVDGGRFSGTYTVSADGTGTLDATSSFDPNFHFVFVTSGSHIYAFSPAGGSDSRLIVFDASRLP
jgi:hypothetical protein